MYGIGEKYQYLEFEPFEFPQTINLADAKWFKNEREFLEFLIRNEWIQRRLGFKIPPSNGLFPDVCGTIFDKEQTKIRVEVEYRAENYGIHGHPFGKADLVLSFIRRCNKKIIRGCPIWSFYTQKGNGCIEYCLDKDVNFDFLKYDPDKDSAAVEYYEEAESSVEPFKIKVTQKTEKKRKRTPIKKKVVKKYQKPEPRVYVEVRSAKRDLKVGDWFYSHKKHCLVAIENEDQQIRVNKLRRMAQEFLL